MASSRPSTPSPREATALSGVRALVAELTQSARAVERRTGATNAQLFLLRQLAEAGDLTINELAERAQTSQSTVSIVVSRLAAGGLVRRSRATSDKRRVVVHMTAKGARLQRRAPEAPTTRLTRALAQMPAARLKALEHGLAALLEHMQVDVSAAPMLFEQTRPRRKQRR